MPYLIYIFWWQLISSTKSEVPQVLYLREQKIVVLSTTKGFLSLALWVYLFSPSLPRSFCLSSSQKHTHSPAHTSRHTTVCHYDNRESLLELHGWWVFFPPFCLSFFYSILSIFSRQVSAMYWLCVVMQDTLVGTEG